MPGTIPEGAVVCRNAHCVENIAAEPPNLPDDSPQVELLLPWMPSEIKEHFHGSLSGPDQVRTDSTKDQQRLIPADEQLAQGCDGHPDAAHPCVNVRAEGLWHCNRYTMTRWRQKIDQLM